MSLLATKIDSLQELFVEELRDLYDAETQLVKALPKMAEAASDAALRQGFEQHLFETKNHIDRLERSFDLLEEEPKGKTCQAMRGLIDEGDCAISLKASAEIRDADLIGAAQRVEHYEIAAYGTARAFAETLGQSEIAGLLGETLAEEAATDQKLTSLAQRINRAALASALPERA